MLSSVPIKGKYISQASGQERSPPGEHGNSSDCGERPHHHPACRWQHGSMVSKLCLDTKSMRVYPPLATIKQLFSAYWGPDGGLAVTRSQDKACGADVDQRLVLSAGVRLQIVPICTVSSLNMNISKQYQG